MTSFSTRSEEDFKESKMKLSFEQIRSLAFGAASAEQTEEGILFTHCTKKQIDAWTALGQVLGERAALATGVCLDFHTSSKSIEFDAPSGQYEIYVNNLFVEQYSMEALHEKGEAVKLAIEGGEENRITVVFPYHNTKGIIKYVELDDGATLAPHKYDMKMLFIGDSITQGWNSARDSLGYAPRVARFFNAETINQGIGGAVYHESTFDKLDFDPDVVIIAYGTNDCGRYPTVSVMQEHAHKFLGLVKKEYEGKNTKIVLLSPIWRLDVSGERWQRYLGCCKAVREEAENYGFYFVDGHELVPKHLSFFADAGLHPNEQGFSLYAENLIAKLVKII